MTEEQKQKFLETRVKVLEIAVLRLQRDSAMQTIISLLMVFGIIGAMALVKKANASEYQDAGKHILKGIAEYPETKQQLKLLEKEFIPQEFKEYGPYIYNVGNLLVEQKIEFKYEWSY